MAQLDKTFPTLDCSMCILAPKMIDCYRNPNVKLLTYSEVKSVSGSVGGFTVEVVRHPRYVDEARCTGCGQCAEKCPKKVPNEFEMGLADRKAVYMPFPQAVPRLMTIDPENCLYLTKGICRVCEKLCQAKAIDFNQKPETVTLSVGAIVVATGFNTLNPVVFKQYGYGKYKNVITSLEFERLICASGPTGGHLARPSDSKVPRSIAFIQCVGSRDARIGTPDCSGVCCMYAAKESILIKEHEPKTEVYVLYMDLRVYGKGFQTFVDRARDEFGVKYIRSKPGEISEDLATGNLTITYEDTMAREIKKLTVEMVILCAALVPRPETAELVKMLGVELDDYGFLKVRHPLYAPVDTSVPGIFVCGCCQGPMDVPSSVTQASGAAARAAEVLTRERRA
jgi:heterodisulfide reductase subunit A